MHPGTRGCIHVASRAESFMTHACSDGAVTRCWPHLAVRVAQLADLQDGAGGLARGQGVPGVRAAGAPVHKQVVARRPEQQVVGLGLRQGLQECSRTFEALH